MDDTALTNDAELLRRMPEPDAIEGFYRRHVDAVLRFAVRRCASPDDVAEIVSGTFLAAIDGAHRFDPARGPARPWLLGIAGHVVADGLRDAYRRSELVRRLGAAPEFADDEWDAVDRMIDAAAVRQPLAAAVAELTEAERNVLLLVAYDGLTVAEASRALGIAPVTGRMRLARARRRLARLALRHRALTPETGCDA